MTAVARRVLVSGRVQGVAFRWHASRRAAELELAGWIRNLHDGRVEAWIEGDGAAVEAMLAWLRKGPPAAHVAGVELREATPEGLTEFDVRRSESLL